MNDEEENITNEVRDRVMNERKDHTVNQRCSFYEQKNEEMEKNINKINHGNQSPEKIDNERISTQKEQMKECKNGGGYD